MDNRKILLVHPEISRTKYNFAGIIDNEPLELEYICTVLKDAGYEPFIWDGQVEEQPFVKRLAEISPFAVYVCGRTRQENFMKEYCRAAKDIGCITMIGGLHAQLNFKRFFCEYIDYVLTSFDIFHIADILIGSFFPVFTVLGEGRMFLLKGIIALVNIMKSTIPGSQMTGNISAIFTIRMK